MKDNHYVDGKPKTRVKLTWREKSELISETIITLGLLVLLNIAVVVIFKQIVLFNPQLENLIFSIKKILWDNYQFSFFLSWRYIFIVTLPTLDISVTIWRIHRRYRQFILWHIMDELHYIANGHYNHVIPYELSGELGDIVQSINELVTNVTNALKEEQAIKRSKDELITNVSHDIRTPLTSIIGYLQLINTKQYHSEEEAYQYASIAYNKAKQMKGLVDDLFEYATLDQPSTQLNLSKFDLQQLVKQLSVDFSLQIEKKHITLNTDISPNPCEMVADAEQIVRIFSNLISNALKYGHGANKIEIIARKHEDLIKIIVRNNGEPIPKKALDKLFDRFYRVDSSRNQAIQGTGLGLAIVQSIVALHNGSISVESDKHWTSFIIELPVEQTTE